jgi:hypothetical protein
MLLHFFYHRRWPHISLCKSAFNFTERRALVRVLADWISCPATVLQWHIQDPGLRHTLYSGPWTSLPRMVSFRMLSSLLIRCPLLHPSLSSGQSLMANWGLCVTIERKLLPWGSGYLLARLGLVKIQTLEGLRW